MSHIWTVDDSAGWTAHELENAAYALRPSPATLTRQELGSGPPTGGALLLPCLCPSSAAREAFALLVQSPDSARLNGLPLHNGVRVLRDRDSIQLADRPPVYFSSERLPAVEPLPGSDKPCFCPRCKALIETGTPAVRCAGCGSWFHESNEFPCFTYSASCSVCGNSTALDADYRWTPHEL